MRGGGPASSRRVDTVGKAIRTGWLAASIAALTMMGSAAPGMAAIAPPTPAGAVASILPANGAVVGVAHPVIVTFTGPVTNRSAAERAIKVTAPNHMTGAFDWPEPNVVEWKPDGYWPAHSHVGVAGARIVDRFRDRRRSGRHGKHFRAHLHGHPER